MKFAINYGPSANNTTISFATGEVIFEGVTLAFRRLYELKVLQQVEVVRASPGYVTEETDGGKWGFHLNVVVLHGQPLHSPKCFECELIENNDENPSQEVIARQIISVVKKAFIQISSIDQTKAEYSKKMQAMLWQDH